LRPFLPPSKAVRREIRKMELEAEIENAGRSVMSATGGVSGDVNKPSREALEAIRGGPAATRPGRPAETDFVERVRALAEEEEALTGRLGAVGGVPSRTAYGGSRQLDDFSVRPLACPDATSPGKPSSCSASWSGCPP